MANTVIIGVAFSGSGSKMFNLVEKFMPRSLEAGGAEGVVAIEYVLVAGFVVAGVAVVFSPLNLWQDLMNLLDGIVS